MRVLTCKFPDAFSRTTATEIRFDPDGWLTELARPAVFGVVDRAVATAWRTVPSGLWQVQASAAVKSLAMLEQLLRAMAQAGVQRRGSVVAIGGGATCDLAGLAAAVYLRGVALVLVPTTLLAAVDASVGGKTAVDLPEGKNLVGAFWPAHRVVIDARFLTTLSEAEFRSGLGEVAKIAIGLDAELFGLLERHAAAVREREPALLTEVIERCLTAKIKIVEQDPWERGPRRLLNLGHTLGHALEAHARGSLGHGIAVARGLHFALALAERRGRIAASDARRSVKLLDALGLPCTPLPEASTLLPWIARDKKTQGTAVHFVFPEGIGQSQVVELELAELAGELGIPPAAR